VAARTGSEGVLVAKGDILAFNGVSDMDRHPVSGVDGRVLIEDSTQPLGLRYVNPSQLAGLGPAEVFVWGSDIGSTGKFYQTGGEPDGVEISPLDNDGEFVIEFACKLSSFSWSTEFAAASSRWQIYKNGVALAGEIVTTTGAVGTNAPAQATKALGGTAFAIGDRIGVLFLSGTVPKRGNVRVGVVTP
jgi:hypothetical protein